MSPKLHVLNYMLEVKPPLYIGAGIKRGARNETLSDMVPGNTLRGLIGHSLLKLTCSNPNIPCNTCKEKQNCTYNKLIGSWKLGEGAYFHPGGFQNIEKKTITGVQLERKTKKVVKTSSPFFYETIYSKYDKIKLNSKIIVKDSDEDINALKNAVKASIGMGLGGRRSWSWGNVANAEITGVDAVELESFSRINTNNLELKVKTPLPITKANIADSIKQGIHDLLSSFYTQNLPTKSDFKIELREFNLKPITSWTESEKKPLGVHLALKTGTQFRLMGGHPEVATLISQLTSIVGITESGHWFTNAGYGLCETIGNT